MQTTTTGSQVESWVLGNVVVKENVERTNFIQLQEMLQRRPILAAMATAVINYKDTGSYLIILIYNGQVPLPVQK